MGYSAWGHKELHTTVTKQIPCESGFPGGSHGKESTCNAGDPGSGGRHNSLLHYSYLENPVYRGAWWATVHVVAKSWA